MRVIAGTRKSLRLKTVPGTATRPTTDRIKETLFNMLQPYLPNASFLDLFSGSGGIGIEALSRGASGCVFVDNSPEAAAVIRANLEFTKFTENAELLRMDALKALKKLEEAHHDPFDVVFMDPPYRKGLENEVLSALYGSPLITDDSILIFEASADTDITFVSTLGYQLIKDKRYGTNRHVWLRKEVI